MNRPIAFFIFILLASCVDSAHFEVPQPEGVKDEKSISKKLIGKYLAYDSTLLTITSHAMIKSNLTKATDSLPKQNPDTLYFQSDKFRLRKFKGYYFLSQQIFEGAWQVQKIEETKDGLILGSIATKLELNNLRTITETGDSTNVFKPTKQQFKKLIEQNGFRTEQRFLRIE